MTKLTRERVLHEIDEMLHRITSLKDRFRNFKNEPACNEDLIIELNADLKERETELRCAKQLIYENSFDFRMVESILTNDRQILAEVAGKLDRVAYGDDSRLSSRYGRNAKN